MHKVILLPTYYKSTDDYDKLFESLQLLREKGYIVVAFFQNYPYDQLVKYRALVDHYRTMVKPDHLPEFFTNHWIRQVPYDLARSIYKDDMICYHIDDDFIFTDESYKYYDRAYDLLMKDHGLGLVKVNYNPKPHDETMEYDEFMWTSAGIVHRSIGSIFDPEVLSMRMGGDDLAIYLHHISHGFRYKSINNAKILVNPDLVYDNTPRSDSSDAWRVAGSHDIIEHYMIKLGLPNPSKYYDITTHKLISMIYVQKYLKDYV